MRRYTRYCLLPLAVILVCGSLVAHNAFSRFAARDGIPMQPAFLEEAVSAVPGVFEGKIDINSASAETLTMLDGIGEVLAQRIVEKREELGGFTQIEELKTVKGIGDALFEKIRGQITVKEYGS